MDVAFILDKYFKGLKNVSNRVPSAEAVPGGLHY